MTSEMKIIGSIGAFVIILIGASTWFATTSGAAAVATKDVTASASLSDAGLVSRGDAYSQGDASAKVSVVEFADFECPACAVQESALTQILSGYPTSEVRFSFRNFPLAQHKNAQIAATAAEAAGAQGKYWQMHDLLFAHQSSWVSGAPAFKTYVQAETVFVQYATDLGLNIDLFKSALESRMYDAKLSRDLADAKKLGIDSTPTYYVDGTKIEGLSTLSKSITAALAK